MTDYIAQVRAILGPLSTRNGVDTIVCNNASEARQCIAILRQKKTEINLVKKQLLLEKRQVHSKFTGKKAQVGNTFGSLASQVIIGKKATGHNNAFHREQLRRQEQHALAPFVQAEQFIATILAQLDQRKLEMELYIQQHP